MDSIAIVPIYIGPPTIRIEHHRMSSRVTSIVSLLTDPRSLRVHPLTTSDVHRSEIITQDIEKIRALICNFIERTSLVSLAEEEILPNSNLYEAGILDSFALVETIAFLESEFTIKLSDDELLSPELSSMEGMAQLVRRKLALVEDI
jgi:acyl carrier protein